MFEDSRENVDFDNGTISLVDVLDRASKTATISTLTSIRLFSEKAVVTPEEESAEEEKSDTCGVKET